MRWRRAICLAKNIFLSIAFAAIIAISSLNYGEQAHYHLLCWLIIFTSYFYFWVIHAKAFELNNTHFRISEVKILRLISLCLFLIFYYLFYFQLRAWMSILFLLPLMLVFWIKAFVQETISYDLEEDKKISLSKPVKKYLSALEETDKD